MRLIADLHVHSHYSRATSRDLTIHGLLAAALRKGIGLIGTGDITHPGWLGEVRASLVEDGTGLLQPRPEVQAEVLEGLPSSVVRQVRFVLTAEISSIWRKGERVRKVHTVVVLSSIAAAERFGVTLGRLGNVTSDGRPILGLAPAAILRLAREADPEAFVIPAHVWTPHFSVFGAMSGFDSLEECFEDLTGEIFAVETGLSSDVVMNRRWSALDHLALVSSSDAHSPAKVGREATIFDCEPTFASVKEALRNGSVRGGGVLGTIEFFPEEGKYHLDGHRKCKVRTLPMETRRLGGRCPECGGKLTPGVLGRVEELADRPDGPVLEHFPPQWSLIPLAEVLVELLSCGPASGTLARAYDRVIAAMGPELEVLAFAELSDVEHEAGSLLAEAVRRMREGRVHLEPGYDGEYGVVRVFEPGEVERLRGQGVLFEGEARVAARRVHKVNAIARPEVVELLSSEGASDLTAEQRAATLVEGPALVVAGPGSGKTRVLVARAERLLRVVDGGILVVTFTNRAADEVRARLGGDGAGLCRVTTFHAFAFAELLRLRPDVPDPVAALGLDGLVPALVAALKADPGACEALQKRYPHVLVDEFQDIDPVQLELLALLVPAGDVFAVGDPAQSIYGFRGAEPRAFDRFCESWPSTRVCELKISHRLTPEVVAVASAVMRGAKWGAVAGSAQSLCPGRTCGEPVTLYRARDPADEAAYVRRAVVDLIGGTGMNDARAAQLGLGQIAVLGRTHAVLEPIARALEEAGIPTERVTDRPLWHMSWVQEAVAALRAARPEASGADVVRRVADGVSRMELAAILRLVEGLNAREAAMRLLLLREVDAFGLDPERVKLLTIHAAKGLEFDAVFVVGCEDGVLPQPPRPGVDIEEERRLMFVAITRARKRLCLSWPARGGGGSGAISRFLSELGPGLVAFEDSAVVRRKPVQQVLL